MAMRRTANGAAAGGIAALVWAAIEPVDRRAFGVEYSDVELLGKLVTRGESWPAAGLALHVANGLVAGAAYAQLKPFLPGPPPLRGALAALAENFATWPLTRVVDSRHPARRELPRLWGDRRALAQATFRHLAFGLVLGLLEDRLNADPGAEPPPVPASSNGQGELRIAAVGAGSDL
jgi:hypothetical protein